MSELERVGDANPQQEIAQSGVRSRHGPEWLVTTFTLGAFVLRLIHLGMDSLWYDETVSVMLAGQPAAELIAHTARDIHPPIYYLLLRAWLALTGYPTGHADAIGYRLEFMAGFLSLLFGVLLVPLAWRLSRRLGLGKRVAVLAALFAAISPFGVWYSQEVRMYTLGACLAAVCLLATTPFVLGDRSRGRLIQATAVFAAAAAIGMATLYYFVFLLASLNLLVLPLLTVRWRTRARHALSADLLSESHRSILLLWLAAQAGAVILYLPWLPVAWRQAANPPVPPWRDTPQIGQALVESWSALSFGQSADPTRLWPLLAITLLLALVGIAWAWKPQVGLRRAVALLATAAFGPLALILLVSTATPLYHARYLFTFAAPFSILLALGVVTVSLWRRPVGYWLAAGAVLALLTGSAISLRAFWSHPAYAADDLRSATRELAQRWRPGDAILVNAGYTYPALLTYWPGPIAWHGRLADYAQDLLGKTANTNGAVILQTGHVDGAADLGWGDPRSDFYALPAAVMQGKLDEVAQSFPRLWQFRLYDTVNDPQGLIRDALENEWMLFDDRVYAGEATLRVQGWQNERQGLPTVAGSSAITFDDWLDVSIAPGAVPTQVESGGTIDLPEVRWSRLSGQPGSNVNLSFRLGDSGNRVWASQDEPLGGNQRDLQDAAELFQPLRLNIPVGVPPGLYELSLVVYDPETAQVLPPGGSSAAGDHVVLGNVQVTRPIALPAQLPAQADFGPVRLVEATTPATLVSPGGDLPVDLLWQAAPAFQPESLVVVVQLLNDDGTVVASLEEEPLQGQYPSSAWQAHELIRDSHRLTVPAGTPAGSYRLIAGLYRAANGERLEARTGLLGLRRRDFVEIKKVGLR